MKIRCLVELEPDEGGLAGAIRVSPDELQRLLSCLSGRAENVPRGRPVPRVIRSRCERDPVIRNYLEGQLRERVTMDELRRRVVELVGVDRAPSRTSIASYVRKRRLEIGL